MPEENVHVAAAWGRGAGADAWRVVRGPGGAGGVEARAARFVLMSLTCSLCDMAHRQPVGRQAIR